MRTLVFGAVSAVSLIASATVFPPSAHAVLQIALEAGAGSFSCVDNAGCDLNPAVGTLSVGDVNVGGLQVNGSLQTATKGSLNILNTSSLSVINTTGGSIDYAFAVGDTDFVGPVDSFSASGSGTWQTAAGSTILMQWFNDPNNQQGASTVTDTPGDLIHSFSDVAGPLTDAFSTTLVGATNDPSLFSMTQTAEGTLVAGGQLLNRGQTEIKIAQAIPEPGTLGLLGGALLSLGLWYRRRVS